MNNPMDGNKCQCEDPAVNPMVCLDSTPQTKGSGTRAGVDEKVTTKGSTHRKSQGLKTGGRPIRPMIERSAPGKSIDQNPLSWSEGYETVELRIFASEQLDEGCVTYNSRKNPTAAHGDTNQGVARGQGSLWGKIDSTMVKIDESARPRPIKVIIQQGLHPHPGPTTGNDGDDTPCDEPRRSAQDATTNEDQSRDWSTEINPGKTKIEGECILECINITNLNYNYAAVMGGNAHAIFLQEH